MVSSLLKLNDPNADTQHPIFILAPPSSSIITSVHTLLCQKLMLRPQRPGQSTESTALRLLENVQLLQYLDLPGLAESLSEVSQRLFESAQGFEDTSDASKLATTKSPGSIVLVQSLSQILGSIQRRSGPVQTCSLLSNLLRTIRHLSRSYRDTVVLLELKITTDNPFSEARKQEIGQIESAFSTATGDELYAVPESIVGGVMEREIDVLVCVHDGFGKTAQVSKGSGKEGEARTQTRIVEVVKDRVGERFGKWCIWVQ
jgi:hypothetical protein